MSDGTDDHAPARDRAPARQWARVGRAAALVSILVAGTVGSGGASPPSSMPLPPPRPAPEGEAAPPDQPTEAPAPQHSPPPVAESPPRAGALPAATPMPPPRPVDRPAPGGEVEACRARLRELGVRFEALPPISDGACGAPSPVRVSGLAGGIDLMPPATVTCPVAEAFARWVQDSLVPEADRLLGRRPRRLRVGSYECRGRNRLLGARLSEHAFANAIDLMGVEFEQGFAYTVAFQKPGAPEERFQSAIRTLACGRFATVLGPGADESHRDHLHLDLRARRGGAICE